MSVDQKYDGLLNRIEHGDLQAAKEAAVQLCRCAIADTAAGVVLTTGVERRPQLFRHPDILTILVNLLRTRPGGDPPGGGAMAARRLACSVLARSYRDHSDWPIEFVQIYLDDSLGSRGWVDDAECKVFISNVRTAWDRKADKEKKGAPSSAPARRPSISSTPLGTPSPSRAPPTPATVSSTMSVDGDSSSGEEEVLEQSTVGGHLPPQTPAPPPSAASSSADPDPVKEAVPQESVASGSAAPVLPPSTPAAASVMSSVTANSDSDSDSGDEEVLDMAVVGPGPTSPLAQIKYPVEAVLPEVCMRYEWCQANVEQLIRGALEARLQPTSSGPMGQVIATLTDMAAASYCRTMATHFLGRWLSTPAQSQKAKALLIAVVKDVDPVAEAERPVVEALLGLRLPAQQAALFTECIATLVQKHPTLLSLAIRHFVAEAIRGDAEGGAPSSYKALGRVFEKALAQQQETKQVTPKHWLTRSVVGRELALLIKEYTLSGGGAQASEACLASVRALTLESCDILRLVGELLLLPTDRLQTSRRDEKKNGPAREYIKNVSTLVSELIKYRGDMVNEASKAINDQYRRENRGRTVPDEAVKARQVRDHWGIRLTFIQELTELHALVAHFCVQVAEQLPSCLGPPPPEDSEDDPPPLTRAETGDKALTLFRTIILYLPTVDKALQRTAEGLANTYVGVKDQAVRALARLALGPKPFVPPETILSLLEDLMTRAGDVLGKREKDPHAASLIFNNLPAASLCVELSFPDDRLIPDFFALSAFHWPSSALEAKLQLKKPLAHAALFWRIALLLVLVSSCNPSTVGRWLWHNCPTLRCLMQMVVCSQYQFPPPGASTLVSEQSVEGVGAVMVGGFTAGERRMLEDDADLTEEETRIMSIVSGEEGAGGGSFKKKSRKRSRQHFQTWGEDGESSAPRTTRSRTRAAENASENRGKQTRLIFLDLAMPPRSPPPDVLQQLRELDEKLNMGARFRRSTDPDFVAAAIAGDDSTRVSRHLLENSIGWLAPAVAAEPDVTMRRLPLGCICHMLMMAYLDDAAPPTGLPPMDRSDTGLDASASGADASYDALVRLRGPLRAAVAAALTGEGGGEYDERKAHMALGLFLGEVRHSSSKRRAAARRALESIIGIDAADASGAEMQVDRGEAQGATVAGGLRQVISTPSFLQEARREHCSWAFNLERLPAYQASPNAVLEALSLALQVEGSHYVISYYLLALHDQCHRASDPSPASAFDMSKSGDERGNLRSPSFSAWVLCTALSSRRLVMQATAERFPRLQALIMDEVHATMQQAASSSGAGATDSAGPTRLWKGDRQVHILLPGCRPDEPLLLPHALLQACVAVLSVYPHAELPVPLASVLNALFPPPPTESDGAPSTSTQYGAAGATLVENSEEPALTAEDWIYLAKSPCPAISEGTSRCMPALLLCRLLLCSGLSDHCFRRALERIDHLARHDTSGATYLDLLSPASTASWGMARALGTRKALTRKLFRRVTAYLRLQATSAATQSSGRFLEWLNKEVASAELETQHRAMEGDHPTAQALTLTALPPAAAVEAVKAEVRPELALAAALAGMANKPPPPKALLAPPPADTLVQTAEARTTQAMAQQWTQPSEAESLTKDVLAKLSMALKHGSLQLVACRLDETASLLCVARAGLSGKTEPGGERRGVKRSRAKPETEPATPMEGDGGGEPAEPAKPVEPWSFAAVGTQALDVLHAYVSKASPYSSPSPVLLLTSLRLCDLCAALLPDETLGAKALDLLHSLLFYPRGAPATDSPGLRPALLSHVLRIVPPDQLQLLAHRLLTPSPSLPNGLQEASPDEVDMTAAAVVLMHFFLHPQASPMVAELGISAFTGPWLVKLKKPRRHKRKSDGGQGPRYPSNLTAQQASVLVSILLYAGRSSVGHRSTAKTREWMVSFLTTLVQRNHRLCGPLAMALVGTCVAVQAALPTAEAMDVESVASPTNATKAATSALKRKRKLAEAMLVSLYLGFPLEVAEVLRKSAAGADAIVTMLCNGQAALTAVHWQAKLNHFERRLVEDVANLCSPAIEVAYVMSSLGHTMTRHPFLFLRHLESLLALLDLDASPGPLVNDASVAPFALRKRAPVPADAVAVATMANQRSNLRVRVASWGWNVHTSLWEHLLEVATKIPSKVYMTFFTPSKKAAGVVVVDFLRVYFRLLAVIVPNDWSKKLAAMLKAFCASLQKDNSDLISGFMSKRLPIIKKSPTDLLAKHLVTTDGQA